MACIIQNSKGFKIVKLSRSEFKELGGMSICDGCNKPMETGYYIGVLNYAYCETDYNNWLLRATRKRIYLLKKKNSIKLLIFSMSVKFPLYIINPITKEKISIANLDLAIKESEILSSNNKKDKWTEIHANVLAQLYKLKELQQSPNPPL